MYPLPPPWLAHDYLCDCLVVFALMNKIIADLLPEEVAINDRFIYLLSSLFGGMVPFRDVVQVFLHATCSLERCNFCVKVGLKEKWYASICQCGFVDRDKTTHDTLERGVTGCWACIKRSRTHR